MPGPLVTASLISAGSSLLGGIFGKSKRRSTVPNFAEMRDKARAAGFNPLTALRATGGGIAPAQAISPLSTRAAIGNAIAQFGGTYAQGAIQKETQRQANEEWTRRHDYAFDKRNPGEVSGVSAAAAGILGNSRPSNEIGERTFDRGGNFPRVDPHSDRPNDARIGFGPLRDRYVIPYQGEYYLSPKGAGASGMKEETIGGLTAELSALIENVSGAIPKGWDKVTWNPDTGEVTGIKPKGASVTRQRDTPDVPTGFDGYSLSQPIVNRRLPTRDQGGTYVTFGNQNPYPGKKTGPLNLRPYGGGQF